MINKTQVENINGANRQLLAVNWQFVRHGINTKRYVKYKLFFWACRCGSGFPLQSFCLVEGKKDFRYNPSRN